MGYLEMELVELFETLEVREYQQVLVQDLEALFPEISWEDVGRFLVEELHA